MCGSRSGRRCRRLGSSGSRRHRRRSRCSRLCRRRGSRGCRCGSRCRRGSSRLCRRRGSRGRRCGSAGRRLRGGCGRRRRSHRLGRALLPACNPLTAENGAQHKSRENKEPRAGWLAHSRSPWGGRLRDTVRLLPFYLLPRPLSKRAPTLSYPPHGFRSFFLTRGLPCGMRSVLRRKRTVAALKSPRQPLSWEGAALSLYGGFGRFRWSLEKGVRKPCIGQVGSVC